MKATLLGLALLVLAAPAHAQSSTAPDSRWSSWLGCWELVTENVRQGARTALPLSQLQDGRPRICVTPSGDGGARFETTVTDKPAVEYTIVADGSDRALTDTECRGTQRAEWSEDGQRLFARAELTCEGDQGPRKVSGLALIAANGNWIDVQAVAINGRENVRVRRYRRAGEGSTSLQTIVGSSLSLDDVKEASGKVSSLALEAALVETSAGYDLTASKLVDLDRAGVSDSVIDLIVALSYPEKFVVERTARATPTTTFVNDPFSLGWFYGHPMWYDDFYYSPYSYSPYGSRFGGSVFSDGGIFLVPAGSVSAEPQPSGAGRVVDGLGYTRVRPREAESTAVNTGTRSRTSSVGGDSGSSSTGSSSGSSGSSSGSSGASSGGGYTAGGSSGGTGRTAEPR